MKFFYLLPVTSYLLPLTRMILNGIYKIRLLQIWSRLIISLLILTASFSLWIAPASATINDDRYEQVHLTYPI